MFSRLHVWVADLSQVKCDEIQPRCGVGSRAHDCQRYLTDPSDKALHTPSQGMRLGSAMECRLSLNIFLSELVESETDRGRSSATLLQVHKANTAMSPHQEVLSGIVSFAISLFRRVSDSRAATVKPDSPRNSDSGLNLPAFATLTNDEDRERKAESTLPGTYSVVVTPKSFADLPEYAISGESSTARGQTSARHSARIGSGRGDRTRSDPNVIVLDRFEDLSPTTSVTSPLVPPTRQGNLPETLQHMSLSVPSVSSASSQASTPVTHYPPAEGRLVSHFRRYIVTRLVPKNIEDNYGVGSTPMRDIFEDEAARFPPVRSISMRVKDRADIEKAAPCHMRTQRAEPQLSRPSYSRRSHRALRSSSLSTHSHTFGRRFTIRRRLPQTLSTVHLRHLHDRRCE